MLGLACKTGFSQVPSEFYYVNALKSSTNGEVVKVIQDDITGDYIVVGKYRGGSIALDPAYITPTYTASGIVNSYVAMYDVDGNYLWSISLCHLQIV